MNLNLLIGETLADSGAVSSALPSASPSSSVALMSAARALNVLLKVGQPEHADEPPVPSQRPSPGQVPSDVTARRGRGLRGAGVAGFDDRASAPRALCGRAGDAVRLTEARDDGRGTRRDFK
jgi:hypothetical protein